MAYYRRPEFDKRLADTIAANARLARQDAMTQARAAEQQRARAKQMMDQVEQMHIEIDATASGVGHAAMQQDYLANYSRARIAEYNAGQLAKQAHDAQTRYDRSLDRYNNFIKTQQDEYNRWRQNIRQPDIVHAEIDSVSHQLSKLTSRRDGLQNINLRMAGNTGYAGSIAAWDDNFNVQKQIDSNMAQLKQLNARIAQLTKSQTLLQEEADWGEYFRYADLAERPDFEQKSKYVTTANGKRPFGSLSGGPLLETGFDDYLYDYINKNPAAQNVQLITGQSSGNKDHMAQMSDDEIATFNYLYATQGKDQAYQYITYLEKDLNYRQRKEDKQYWKQFAKDHPVGASALTVATSPAKGLSYIGQAVDLLTDGKIDHNAGYNRSSYINNDIRGQVAEKIQNKWGDVGSFAYMTGMSMADFLLNTGIGGGNRAIPLAIMGSGAAADTTIQAKERGLDDKQAFTLGTIAGLAEIATEKVSIDYLLNPDLLKDSVKMYIVKNFFAEGSEEATSDLINLYADILVSKEKSEWLQSIEAYKKQGKTEHEAFARAFGDQAATMGMDFLGGAISGGIMSSVNAGRYLANHKIHDYRENRQTTKNQVKDRQAGPEGLSLPRLDEEFQSTSHANQNLAENRSAEPEGLSLPRLDEEFQSTSHANQNLAENRSAEPEGLRLGQMYEEELARREELLPGIPLHPELQPVRQMEKQEMQEQIRLNEEMSMAEQIRREGVKYEENTAAEYQQPERAALLDEGQERSYRAGSGEQTGTVEVLPEASRKEPGTSAQRRVNRQHLKRNLRQAGISPISPKELGVVSGSDRQNVLVVPEEMWDADLREAAQIVREDAGVEPVFVSGLIRVKGSDGKATGVRGAYTGDKIIIQADNIRLTPQQIADHEVYHKKAEMAPSLNKEIQSAIVSKYGREEFMQVLKQYIEALAGVYGNGNEAAQQIAEEVFADAYAGINSFGAKADRFGSVVNERMDDLWIGKSRYAQENGVRQTRGPNSEQGKYSVEDEEPSGIQLEKEIPEYPYNMQTVIQDYLDAVDEDVMDFIADVKDGKTWAGKKIEVGYVDAQMAKDIENLTGVKNTEGNSIFMNTSAVQHIVKRHGVNGEADHSMSHDQDLARINYVLQNYDHIEYDERRSKEYRNRDNSLAPSVLVSKKINGTYFVVEAVPDTEKTAIVSAYINKKGTAQVPDDNAPGGDVRNELASAPMDNLSHGKHDVKGAQASVEYAYMTDPSSTRYSVEDDVDDAKRWDFRAAEAMAEAQTRDTKNYILQKELGPEGYQEYLRQKKEEAAREKLQRKEENTRKAEQRRQTQMQEKAQKAQLWQTKRDEVRAKLESEVKPAQAKKDFCNNVTALFSIPAGRKKEINSILDSFADRVARKEYIGQDDRDALFDRLYREGVMNVEAEEVYQLGRNYVEKGKIYVPESIRKEFGDDWGEFRRKAFANQVYLTSDKSAAGIDQWNAELAEILPVLFNSEETDMRMALEQIVSIAEEGKTEKMSLPEYTALLAGQERVSEDRLLDDMERNLDNAIAVFAKSANLETKLRNSLIHKQEQIEQRSFNQVQKEAERRQRRKDLAERERAQRELKELQKKTLKALQWLSKNRNRAPEELKETWDEVLGDIDLYAVGAANEMNWSDKYQATWKDLAQMYKDARAEDPNFLPSEELKKIVDRLEKMKIEDLDLDALQDLYKAAVGLRTEYHNRNNVIMDQEHRIFEEVYDDSIKEIEKAPKRYKGTLRDSLVNLEQLTPMNVIQRMVGWNPDSSFYAMAKQLEKGERETRAYTVKAERMLEKFLREHEDWVKKADGQGKDAIWYTITVPELLQLGHGNAPIFGKSITVSLTPAQKVHMYLESKNYDNLRHMAGGRTFVNQKLYSEGKRSEAFAQGTTVRLAPETVKEIVKTLTPEEMELAKILDRYYNSFAKKEINRVSNILYGYDKALGNNYAPIRTNDSFNKSEPGVFNTTAESAGSLKERIVGSNNPSLNISAFDAFERHVDETGRFVGTTIPIQNWNTLMNWKGNNTSMKEVIKHKWGEEGKAYLEDVIIRLGRDISNKTDSLSNAISNLQSNYISAVFGLNPSIVLKQLGSIPMAAGYLGTKNLPSVQQIKSIDKTLISKYTQDLEWRTMGYSMPETKQLKDNPNWTQSNKTFQFWFGGGAITAMDGWAASVLWPWAENKVRTEYPDLQMGTEAEINAGESPFYKKVAEEFDDAVARSQSVADELHQSTLRKSKNPITKAFTLFRSDTAQTYNALRQKIGEAQYYERKGMQKQARAARKAVGAVVGAMLINNAWAAAITMLAALWKHRDKRYRDDEGNLTAGSVLSEILNDMAGSVAGVVIGGEELYELIGNIITGERWYDIDTPGMDQLNDALDAIRKAGTGIKDIVQGGVDVVANGGNLGMYLYQQRNNILGGIKNVAATAATYLGLPAKNLEAYLMGTVKTVFPSVGTKYEDLLEAPAKKGLTGLEGKSLRTRMRDILHNRRIELDAETINELAEQYEAGNHAAFPSDVPRSVSVNGEDRKLSPVQQQIYDIAWARVAGSAIAEMVKSDQYRKADDAEKKRMLNRLYDYAATNAKAELFDDYEISSTAVKNGKIISAGVKLSELILWESKVTEMKSGEKAAALAEWNIPLKAKRMVFSHKISDSNEDKIDAIMETGVSFDKFLHIYSKYAELRNADMKPGEKAIDFAKWIDGQRLEREQKLAIKENLKYFAMMPMNSSKYDKLVDAGIESDEAYELTKEMEKLEPQDGNATVSDVQKWRVCIDFSDDISDQVAALSMVMSENQLRNLEVADRLGVKPRDYVMLQEIKVRFDADGNGSFNQKENKAAIDNMRLSRDESAVLWQLANGSSSAKNNPYSPSIGQKVKSLIAKKKEESKSPSFSEEIMRQLTGNR